MRRFSIRTLMAVVVVIAVGLAALRNANEGWAEAMMLVALAAAIIWIAVLRAVILRGKERYRQAGFALACCAYLVVALGPQQPLPGTTRLLNYLYAQMHPPLRVEILSSRSVTYAPGAKPVIVTYPVGPQLQMPTMSRAPDAFLCIGHCLFALLAGLIGGMIATWFYARRERRDTAG